MTLPQGDYLQAVRSSCRALTENGPVKVGFVKKEKYIYFCLFLRHSKWFSKLIFFLLLYNLQVSSNGVKSFLKNLDKHRFEELSIDTPMRMPLKFSSLAEELNFVALIDLLNFGSGYRVPLHELAGRG